MTKEQAKKPSKAQFEVLSRAMMNWAGIEKPIGRLLQGYASASVTTLSALKDRGWIEDGQFIRDPVERLNIKNAINERIGLARNALTDGSVDWISALSQLRMAYDANGLLNRTAYWITESGKKVLEEAKGVSAGK